MTKRIPSFRQRLKSAFKNSIVGVTPLKKTFKKTLVCAFEANISGLSCQIALC